MSPDVGCGALLHPTSLHIRMCYSLRQQGANGQIGLEHIIGESITTSLLDIFSRVSLCQLCTKLLFKILNLRMCSMEHCLSYIYTWQPYLSVECVQLHTLNISTRWRSITYIVIIIYILCFIFRRPLSNNIL